MILALSQVPFVHCLAIDSLRSRWDAYNDVAPTLLTSFGYHHYHYISPSLNPIIIASHYHCRQRPDRERKPKKRSPSELSRALTAAHNNCKIFLKCKEQLDQRIARVETEVKDAKDRRLWEMLHLAMSAVLLVLLAIM